MDLSEFQKFVCADIARGRITDFLTFFELYRDRAVGSTKPFIGASDDPKLFKSRNDVLLYEVLREFIALLRSLERDGLVFLEHIEGKKMIRVSVHAQDICFKVHMLLQKFQKTEIVTTSKLKSFVAKGCQDTPEAQAEEDKSNSNSIANYVAKSRIEELQAITNASFDLKKLIQLCIEINTARNFNCTLSIAMILRAIIDHVPPIFGANSFGEVANNYKNGKSFKELMLRLDTSSRKIADSHLHNQIRKREALPTFNQVNFSAELDVLLAEIIKILD